MIGLIVGLRLHPDDPGRSERLRNADGCLFALGNQAFPRQKYLIYLVEQDDEARLTGDMAGLADQYLFDRCGTPYNRGRAFNLGAKVAMGDGCKTLCFIDADVLVDALWMGRCAAVMRYAQAMIPYTCVFYLSDACSVRMILNRKKGHPSSHPKLIRQVADKAKGGCFWIGAKLFEQVGRFDERFVGWGGEDDEFYHRVKRIAPIVRLDEPLMHLYHPPASRAQAQENADLFTAIMKGEQ